MTTFSFKPQLKVGEAGEKHFAERYDNVTQTDGRLNDFIYQSPEGEKTVELKTDTYSMNKTPNAFMEYYSDMDKGTLGGPWRAARDKVDYFVYYYLSDGKWFWYPTAPLVKFLDKWIKGKKHKEVKNRSYMSCGYAVPREDMAHLEVPEPKRKDKKKLDGE